jgi:hypothetical protein
MIKHISSPTISEEILGAYLEGNLSEYETQRVERILECDDYLDGLVDEIAVENLTILDTDADSSPSIYDENPNFDLDFELPEVESSFGCFPEVACFIRPHVSASSYNEEIEVAACACFDRAIEDEPWDDVIEESGAEEDSVNKGMGIKE